MSKLSKPITVDTFPELVANELDRARSLHDDWPSMEHGFTVIMKELLEVLDEMRKRAPNNSFILAEVSQVAACCQRFAEDLNFCKKE